MVCLDEQVEENSFVRLLAGALQANVKNRVQAQFASNVQGLASMRATLVMGSNVTISGLFSELELECSSHLML